MSAETQQLIQSGGKLFRFNNGGGGPLYGYTPVPPEKHADGTPWIAWRGSKMPHHWWLKMLAFFQWTFDSGKDEALVYFYYNETTKEWVVWAPPQRGFGMTVNRLKEHPNNSQEEAFTGFIRVGTGHHHNSSKAFASGTDNSDEEHFNGIHVTIGEMDKTIHDIHCRAIFNGNKYETCMSHWVEMAPKYAEAGCDWSRIPELEEDAYFYSLRCAAPEKHPFPEEWRANFNAGKTTSFLAQSGNVNGHVSIVQHQHQQSGHLSGMTSYEQQRIAEYNLVASHPRSIELQAAATFRRYREIERYNAAWPCFTPDSPSQGAYAVAFTKQHGGMQNWVNFDNAIKEMKTYLATIPNDGVDAGRTTTRVGMTNAEKGEAEVRELRIPLVELQLTVENMGEAAAGVNKANLEGNKNVMALNEILRKWGLNIAWLVKLADRMEMDQMQAEFDNERGGWPMNAV